MLPLAPRAAHHAQSSTLAPAARDPADATHGTRRRSSTIKNVSKSFGPVQALKAVNFDLRRGEVHAVAGENGAGKSTLMNIIDGIVRPDSGEILLDGRPVEITSPAVAQKLGIGFVHQEIELCPDVTVAENMFMAATNSSRSWLMDYAALERRAGDVLRQLGDVDPRALVRDLSISHQQLVEIAKALTLDCRVLILDEPTAALTEREAQTLFGIMRTARRPRHLDHLHLPPDGGDLRQLRPSLGVPRRRAHRHARRRRDDAARNSSTRWSAASSTVSIRTSSARTSAPPT